MPKRQVVFEGKVTDAAYIDLDPGLYVYSVVRRSSPPKIDDAIYKGEFYHEISKEAFKALQMYEPRLFRIMHTSEGVRWRCQHPLCSEEFTTQTSALIHEMEHFGIMREDFLADPTGGASKAAGQRATEFALAMADAAKKQGKQPPSGIPA